METPGLRRIAHWLSAYNRFAFEATPRKFKPVKKPWTSQGNGGDPTRGSAGSEKSCGLRLVNLEYALPADGVDFGDFVECELAIVPQTNDILAPLAPNLKFSFVVFI